MSVFVLSHEQARNRAIEAVRNAPAGYSVVVKPATRSNSQNSLLWPLLEDVANQVVWHGKKLSKEDWKTLFTASLKRQRAEPGLEGGFVVMGEHTSSYTKAQFSDLIELIYSFGSDPAHPVKFRTDKASWAG